MQTTIHGIRVYRYHVNNPHGHVTWYASRAEREHARARLVAEMDAAGLTDPEEAAQRVKRVIRSESARAWYDDLREAGVLRPMDDTSHEWREWEEPYVAELPTGDWTVMQWDPRVECYREGATCRTRAEAREYLRRVKGQE